MANRYWVGGGSSANWNATGNTNWGTASGVRDNASVPGSSDDVIFDNHANGNTPSTISASCTINSLVMTGWANTLTHNASVTVTIDGQNGGGDSLIMASGMTYTFTAATSRITFTGAGTSDITCAGITLPNVTFNNTGDTFSILDTLLVGGTSTTALYLQAGTFTHNNNAVTLNGTTPTINGAFSFHTLNRTGTAVKTDTLLLASNITVTSVLNIDGNSAINRVLVASDTLGTARTLTLTGATISGCSNVDFRDITFSNTAGEKQIDFSGITGGSGDCGGNTKAAGDGGGTLSFTTADDWYWNGSGTRNFSDYTYWYTATNGGGSQMASTRCPLPQDTCYFDGASIDGATTVDQDLPRIPGIDFTGCGAMAFHINNIAQEIYGGLKFVDNVTLTTSTSYGIGFFSRGSVSYDAADKTISIPTSFRAVGGTITLLSGFTNLNNAWLYNGTLDADTFSLTLATFISNNSNARTLLMGSGTWTVRANGGGTPWDFGTTTNLTNPTTMAETSTIVFGYNTSNNCNFHGGGCTYNDVSITLGGTQIVTIQGSNTFNTFTINAPKTVKFTAGTDQTVSSFVATGDADNLIHLDSTSASAATLSDTTGTNTVHYCHIGETGPVNAEGGATWDATDNCEVNTSTGWTTTSVQNATITASAIVVRFVVSSVTIDVGSQSATITATAIRASFVAPAITAQATKNATVIATAIQVSVVAPSVSVSTGGNASVTATAIKSSFVANAVTIEATKNAVAVATAAAVRFLANSVTISATTSAVVSVTSVSVKFVAGVATVQAIRNVTIDATSAYAQFLVNSATIVIGGVDSGIVEVMFLSSPISKRLYEKSRISKRLNEASRIDKTLLLDSPIH